MGQLNAEAWQEVIKLRARTLELKLEVDQHILQALRKPTPPGELVSAITNLKEVSSTLGMVGTLLELVELKIEREANS